MFTFCRCRDCRRARRAGLILGTTYVGRGATAYRASAYVPFPRWVKKGRRPVTKFYPRQVELS